MGSVYTTWNPGVWFPSSTHSQETLSKGLVRPSATFFSLNPFRLLRRQPPLVARSGLGFCNVIIQKPPSQSARLGFGEKKVAEGPVPAARGSALGKWGGAPDTASFFFNCQ